MMPLLLLEFETGRIVFFLFIVVGAYIIATKWFGIDVIGSLP